MYPYPPATPKMEAPTTAHLGILSDPSSNHDNKRAHGLTFLASIRDVMWCRRVCHACTWLFGRWLLAVGSSAGGGRSP